MLYVLAMPLATLDERNENMFETRCVWGSFVLEDFLTKQVRVNLIHHVSIAHRLEATTDAD